MARNDYMVTLRPLPNVDGIRALRAAVKCLLRRYGLRVIRAEERGVEDCPRAESSNAETLSIRIDN
jgi:hypothetical protein